MVASETVINALKAFSTEENLADWALAAIGKLLAGKTNVPYSVKHARSGAIRTHIILQLLVECPSSRLHEMRKRREDITVYHGHNTYHTVNKICCSYADVDKC